MPRGGERREPNPVFLAHAAALTELYVAVVTNARTAKFKGLRYDREGEAREPFKDGMRERALAPDATLGLLDEQDRELWAFVEIDLGTMSHTRLRTKAALYASYIEAEAWRKRHAYPPALLFLTTTDVRARRFLGALARALSYGPRLHKRRAFIAGGAGIAWTPHQLMTDPCLTDLDANTGLTLLDILHAAHAPMNGCSRVSAKNAKPKRHSAKHCSTIPRRCATGCATTSARSLPTSTRWKIPVRKRSSFYSPRTRHRCRRRARCCALSRATSQTRCPNSDRHPTARRGPWWPRGSLYSPGTTDIQVQQIRALAADHGEGPSLQRAWSQLRRGELLSPRDHDQLPQDAERDADGRRDQYERHAVYLEWREQAARQLARKAGPLGRLMHRSEDFYPQLDREHLKVCGTCNETLYPGSRKPGNHLYNAPITCHYCTEPHGTRPYDPDQNASKESEAHQ